MHENPRLSRVKLKNISKQEVSYLLLHFGYILRKNETFQKKFFSLTKEYNLIYVKMKVL